MPLAALTVVLLPVLLNAVVSMRDASEVGRVTPEQVTARVREAQTVCADLRGRNDTPINTFGPLCRGGRAGSPLGPCYQLTTTNWRQFSPYACRPGKGRKMHWVPNIAALLRNKSVAFVGDSLMLQTAAAFLCGFQQTGHPVIHPSREFDDHSESGIAEGFKVPSLGITVYTNWLAELSQRDQRAEQIERSTRYILSKDVDLVVINFGAHYPWFQWGVEKWQEDFTEVADSLGEWATNASGRAVLLAQPLAVHWGKPHWDPQPCSDLTTQLLERYKQVPDLDTLAASGGGARFCQEAPSFTSLMVSKPAVQARLMEEIAHGRPRVHLWRRFLASAHHADRHPGAYWIDSPDRLRCDCAHLCYDDWLWAVHFHEFQTALDVARQA